MDLYSQACSRQSKLAQRNKSYTVLGECRNESLPTGRLDVIQGSIQTEILPADSLEAPPPPPIKTNLLSMVDVSVTIPDVALLVTEYWYTPGSLPVTVSVLR